MTVDQRRLGETAECGPVDGQTIILLRVTPKLHALPKHSHIAYQVYINSTSPAKMLLAKLLLLPFALASTVTLYVSSVPASSSSAIIPSPIPLAQIEYDADQSIGTLASYTPPTGSYASDHLLRVGLSDPKTGSWRGIVTSAASFADQYHKKFVVHVDEKGTPYHVGLTTSAKASGGDEVEVEIVKRNPGPKPVLNKPIVLNAEGKIDSKEPEKSFLQKYVLTLDVLAALELIVTQVLVGGCAVPCHSVGVGWRRWEIGRGTDNLDFNSIHRSGGVSLFTKSHVAMRFMAKQPALRTLNNSTDSITSQVHSMYTKGKSMNGWPAMRTERSSPDSGCDVFDGANSVPTHSNFLIVQNVIHTARTQYHTPRFCKVKSIHCEDSVNLHCDSDVDVLLGYCTCKSNFSSPPDV